LLALIIGVGLFKGNIASQVGALYKENDLRRAMAFQIFYIAINVSVIVAPLISGTLGREGRLALRLRLRRRRDGARRPDLPRRPAASAGRGGRERIDRSSEDLRHHGPGRARHRCGDRRRVRAGILIALAALVPLYFWLTRGLTRDEKMRVLALILLIPAMAVALLTNQEIFNAYLIWADQHFQLTFFGRRSRRAG
jgi:POT family proton-dependent oligopeptide transporter